MEKIKMLNDSNRPKSFRTKECSDVFMNVKQDVKPIRGSLETSEEVPETQEDDTLMGRLGKRMASRDYIDSLNLGMGTKAQRSGKAALADNSGFGNGSEIADNIPSKLNIGGPAKISSSSALRKGTDIEKEHLGTIRKVEDKKLSANDAPKEIAKDHIKEIGPEYYTELPKMEAELKKNEINDTTSREQDEKGFGLHIQTSDIVANNPQDNFGTNNKVIKGSNMADQAKNSGNVYSSDPDVKY